MAPTQRVDFTCMINDFQFHEQYSAEVRITKKIPVWSSLQPGRIDLADIFITPISDQVRNIHNHFALYKFTGHGLYIVRDRYGREIRRTECSTWDLGHPFALRVQEHLKFFT